MGLESDDAGEYVILSGAIDLVYKGRDGWTIVDYKTDAVSEDIDEFIRHYEAQVKAYVRFWQEITGERVARAGLFFVKTKELHEVEI